jgi:hypothetical protein
MEQQHGAMRLGKFLQQPHEFLLLFAANEQFASVVLVGKFE